MNQSANHAVAGGVQDKLLEGMKAALAEAEDLLRSAANATGDQAAELLHPREARLAAHAGKAGLGAGAGQARLAARAGQGGLARREQGCLVEPDPKLPARQRARTGPQANC